MNEEKYYCRVCGRELREKEAEAYLETGLRLCITCETGVEFEEE